MLLGGDADASQPLVAITSAAMLLVTGGAWINTPDWEAQFGAVVHR
jgi:hypothetical protein